MSSDEAGFTLVELLIAVVLLTLLAVTASLLLTSVLKINVETGQGVSGARLTELTIAHFSDDMLRADSAVVPGSLSCDEAPGDISIIQIVVNSTSHVNFVTRLDTGTKQLHRLSCDPTQPTTTTTDVALDTLGFLRDSPLVDRAVNAVCTTSPTLGTTTCPLTVWPCPSSPNWPQNCARPDPDPADQSYVVSGTTRTTS